MYPENNLSGAGERTNNKLNLHMAYAENKIK